jgi:hypothetical protein
MFDRAPDKMLFHDGVDGDLQPEMLGFLLPGLRANQMLERELSPASYDWLTQVENEEDAEDEDQPEEDEEAEQETLAPLPAQTPADRHFRHLLPRLQPM